VCPVLTTSANMKQLRTKIFSALADVEVDLQLLLRLSCTSSAVVPNVKVAINEL